MSGAVKFTEKAHVKYREGDYDGALELYQEALRSATLSAHRIALHSNRAACYLKLKNYAKAAAECSAVLQLDPSHVGALLLRAQTLQAMKDYQAALFDVSRLLELKPDHAPYLVLETKLKNLLAEERSLQIISEADEEREEPSHTTPAPSTSSLKPQPVESSVPSSAPPPTSPPASLSERLATAIARLDSQEGKGLSQPESPIRKLNRIPTPIPTRSPTSPSSPSLSPLAPIPDTPEQTEAGLPSRHVQIPTGSGSAPPQDNILPSSRHAPSQLILPRFANLAINGGSASTPSALSPSSTSESWGSARGNLSTPSASQSSVVSSSPVESASSVRRSADPSSLDSPTSSSGSTSGPVSNSPAITSAGPSTTASAAPMPPSDPNALPSGKPRAGTGRAFRLPTRPLMVLTPDVLPTPAGSSSSPATQSPSSSATLPPVSLPSTATPSLSTSTTLSPVSLPSTATPSLLTSTTLPPVSFPSPTTQSALTSGAAPPLLFTTLAAHTPLTTSPVKPPPPTLRIPAPLSPSLAAAKQDKSPSPTTSVQIGLRPAQSASPDKPKGSPGSSTISATAEKAAGGAASKAPYKGTDYKKWEALDISDSDEEEEEPQPVYHYKIKSMSFQPVAK